MRTRIGSLKFIQKARIMSQGTLIPLFKEQLENQSAAIGSRFERDKRGDHLIWWYFQEIESFAPDEIETVYCDGSSDLGIDAIWIDEDDSVHIYSFKHPMNSEKAFPPGSVDSLIAGLSLIFSGNYASVAHEKLKERLEAIKGVIAKSYLVHIVTSGTGIPDEARNKLDLFVAGIPNPTKDFFSWELVDLPVLQDRFYQQNLPAVQNPMEFVLDKQPYLLESGSAACFFFATSAEVLANFYHIHGEELLHRNIRTDQGDTSANRAIRATCAGEKAKDFIHFNNGVSFLADEVNWDPFSNKLTLTRSQIVNGGQTIRILYRSHRDGSLKTDVRVAVRVIRSGGDKQFGSDVTVNLNNQNSMQTGFLRSTDPCIVQLAKTLESHGWYLERRKGELRIMGSNDILRIEQKIGHSLDGRTIKLKEGTQAYVATYFRHPELAKKNPKKMFQSTEEGGFFERIYSGNISAEKMISAVRILAIAEQFVHQFNLLRNRKKRRGEVGADWEDQYRRLLGSHLVDTYPGYLDQAIPQSAVFLCATIFQEWVDILGKDPIGIPEKNEIGLAEYLDANVLDVIPSHLAVIFEFAKSNPESLDSSWPNMLKANKFLNQVMAYTKGKNSMAPGSRD